MLGIFPCGLTFLLPIITKGVLKRNFQATYPILPPDDWNNNMDTKSFRTAGKGGWICNAHSLMHNIYDTSLLPTWLKLQFYIELETACGSHISLEVHWRFIEGYSLVQFRYRPTDSSVRIFEGVRSSIAKKAFTSGSPLAFGKAWTITLNAGKALVE